MHDFNSTNGYDTQSPGVIFDREEIDIGDPTVSFERHKPRSTKEPPRPLMREMPPADPFPVDALGGLAAAARAIHSRIRAPLAMCGQSVLAAATLAVQGLADVELPTGQTRPLSCFFVTIAASGERKTSVDIEALRAIRQQERRLREEYAAAQQDYQNDFMAWEKAREAAMKKLGSDRAAIKSALDEIGERPKAPLMSELVVDEPTYEGLCKLFAISRPSLGIFTSEGGQFMCGHGMSDEAKLRTATGLSKLWDGGEVKRIRADGTLIMPDRRLSAHLMAQPDVTAAWMNDTKLVDQGLTSRILITAPEGTSGTRFWKEWQGSGVLADYDRKISSLISRPLSVNPVTGGVDLKAITLSPQARKEWIEFHDWTEWRLGDGRDFDGIKGTGNKLAENAVRLAAVLTIAANPDAGEIGVEAMDAGITLARHYASEAIRLFQGGIDDPDLQLAQKTLAWLHKRGPLFSLPDVYQLGPPAIRDKTKAAKVVGILVDHGHIEQMPDGAEVDGKWRREVWRLVLDD